MVFALDPSRIPASLGRAAAPQDSVVVTLMGGLGNQLFQYALGRVLADRWDAPLVVDARWFREGRSGGYQLSDLRCRVDGVVHADEDWDEGFARLPVREEQGFAFDPELLHAPVGQVLTGYFQSPAYFEHREPSVREDLRPARPRGAWASQVAEEIAASARPTSLHVRRGDYLDPVTAAFHGTCTRHYYARALEALGDGAERTTFLFSDDPEWAAQEIAPLVNGRAVVVAAPEDSPPVESLLLMAECQDAILANSSYSWWGAWLRGAYATTIAPRPWFRERSLDTRDLLPAHWLTLDCR